MDPALISKELRIEPEYSFQAGQPRHLRSSIAPAAVHTESELISSVTENFDVTEDVAQSDVRNFMADLLEVGLVRTV